LHEDTWQQLWIELRHLERQLSASPLGWVLVPFERARGRASEAARRLRFVLGLGAEALRDDAGRLAGWLRRGR